MCCILQGDARPLQLLAVALAMGYMYQGPPFRRGCNADCLGHMQQHSFCNKVLHLALAANELCDVLWYRLSYKGLGEPICFVAFGPLSTTAFYLSHVLRTAPV